MLGPYKRIFSVRITLLITLLIFSCSNPESNSQSTIEYPAPGHQLTPHELSLAYCGACHLHPEPELLPKSVWKEKLLKNMGSRLGIVTEGYDPYQRLSMYDSYIVKQSNIYPGDSLIIRTEGSTVLP
jgi:hypothetical protein